MINLRTRSAEVFEKAARLAVKHITPRRLAFLCGLVYFASLIPLLYIARYNHLSMDDLVFGTTTYHAWRYEGSIWAVLKAAAQVSVDNWYNHQGTYITSFLIALQPSIFGSQYYAITTWIALGILTYSVAYIFHTLLVKMLSVDKYLCHIISFVTLFMIVHFMDYWPRIEMFFWYTSLWPYLFTHCIAVMFLAKVASFITESGAVRKKAFAILTASLLGIISGGGGYMAITFTLLASVALLYVAVWRKKRQVLICMLIPIGFFMMSSMLNVFAPGNAVRQLEKGEPLGPLEAIFSSFLYLFNGTYVLRSMFFPMLFLILFLAPIFYKAAAQTTFHFRYPLAVSGFSICLLAATATPSLYAIGTMVRARLVGVFFISFVLILILNEFYLIGWICRRWSRPMELREMRHLFSVISCKTMFVSALVVFLLMGILIMDEHHSFTFSSALKDVYSGKAKAYSEAHYTWDRILTEADRGEEVVIDELPGIPTLFFKSPLSYTGASYHFWRLASYYDLDSVYIRVTSTN